MTTAAPTDRADAGLHTAPDEVWAQVRDDYLAGWSAPACCRRHGVGLSTLRKRAAEEGWRRTDRPWSRPNGLDLDDEGLALEEQFDGDLDQIPLGELSLVAFQRMMRAVLHGKAMEALRWRRVYKAIESEAAEVRRRQQQAERERSQAARREVRDFGDAVVMAAREDYEAALARWKRGEPIDGIDGIDGVFAPSPGAMPSPPVLPGLPGGAALAGAP
ncbi:hypothetical protein [Brevundimonas sp.]|uniref:hypothetical protein n=1 Tax=Brevundimonas sp. TaxID=1871086 RepID=UPI003F6E81BE